MNTFTVSIIFTILLVVKFAENSPVTTPSNDEHEHDVTEPLNQLITAAFRSFQWKNVYVHVRNNTDDNFVTTKISKDVRFQNGMQFYNVSTKFQSSPTLKIRVLIQNRLMAECEMITTAFKGQLKNSSYYITTGDFPLNFTLDFPTTSFKRNNNKLITIDYHKFDQYEMKLSTNGYQYKPNQENEIQKEIKAYLQSTLNETVNQEWKPSLLLLGYTLFSALGPDLGIVTGHADILTNEKKHYYYMNTIPSENFTLNNVTIKGLWNFRSITLDFSRPQGFPELEIGPVNGTMVQSFTSKEEEPLELCFKISTIQLSNNEAAGKINVKADGYSITIAKSNTPLMLYQSLSVMKKIESAIATSISKSSPPLFEGF